MNARLPVAGALLLALAALFSSGCQGSTVRFESPKGVSYDASKGRPVSAEASGFQLLLFIPIQVNDRHQRAYDRLLQQAGGDYVANIQVQESWTWALVGTIYTVRLDGTAYPRN